MSSLQRVRVHHTFTSDPATVFAALSEHENLGRLFGARVTRVRDGDTTRNGVGSVRRLRAGGILPPFEETVTVSEPDTLIEYRITKGGPLRDHHGVQRFVPTADGGTMLDYTIEFRAAVPGLAPVVAAALRRSITAGLPSLVP
jgi:uncharacterized protein YndB with AHSA1/START domain